jgi:hypothetical protein
VANRLMGPQAFVAMVFRPKKNGHGLGLDCNRIFSKLIEPVEEGGLDVFRASEEELTGDFRPRRAQACEA